MKRFFGYFIIFILTVVVVGGSRLLRLKNPRAIYAEEKVSIYIREPMNLEELTVLLVDSAIVVDTEKELQWAAQLLGWNSFKPGHYNIKGGATYDQFLSKLAKGAQDPISVTILPGRRQDSILSKLASNFRFDSTAIYSAVNDSAYLAKKNLSPKTLIGHLYPETYKFYWTELPKAVLNRIFAEFNQAVLKPYQQRFKELDKTVNEILTLASIVEWEAGADSGKRMISGLYWNRLQRGMLLQADPTVNYAIGKRRRLYFDDYEVKDPYNTYIHPGLPPGPITNPDLKSIKAALFPVRHDYLFMVARPGGGHAFSKTYEQHQQKAERWREWLQKQHEIKEQQQRDSLASLSKFSGIWEGSVTRHYNTGSWHITLTINAKSNSYHAQYVRKKNSNLTCKSKLIPQRLNKNQSSTHLYLKQHMNSTGCLDFSEGNDLDFDVVHLAKKSTKPEVLTIHINSGRREFNEAYGKAFLQGD